MAELIQELLFPLAHHCSMPPEVTWQTPIEDLEAVVTGLEKYLSAQRR